MQIQGCESHRVASDREPLRASRGRFAFVLPLLWPIGDPMIERI